MGLSTESVNMNVSVMDPFNLSIRLSLLKPDALHRSAVAYCPKKDFCETRSKAMCVIQPTYSRRDIF